MFFWFCFPAYPELNSLWKPPWDSSFLLSSSFPYLTSIKITQPVPSVQVPVLTFIMNLSLICCSTLSIKRRHCCPLLLNLLCASKHLNFEKHSSTLEEQFIFLLISLSCTCLTLTFLVDRCTGAIHESGYSHSLLVTRVIKSETIEVRIILSSVT